MVHAHGHTCDWHSHWDASRNIWIAFFLNIFFAIIELVSWILFNSTALIADSVHDFWDSLNIWFSFITEKWSKKGRKVWFTYWMKRLSVIWATTNSIILFLSSLFVIYISLPRILDPQDVNFKWVFFIALIWITINGVAYLKTKWWNNLNQKAISWHMLEDVLWWIAILISSIINFFISVPILDPLLAVLIACFIGYNVFKNLRNLLKIFLQATPTKVNELDVENTLKDIPEIIWVHDIHIWTLDNELHIATLHIEIDENFSLEKIKQIKKISHLKLKKIWIWHATIEFDFWKQNCLYNKC